MRFLHLFFVTFLVFVILFTFYKTQDILGRIDVGEIPSKTVFGNFAQTLKVRTFTFFVIGGGQNLCGTGTVNRNLDLQKNDAPRKYSGQKDILPR